MAVTKRLRYEVLRRDAHTCRYCGAKAPDVPLRVDHVQPVALGGRDVPENLVTACFDCNSGKSSIAPDASIVADVAADALRWVAAIREAQQELRDELYVLEETVQVIDEAWSKWKWDHGKPIPKPSDWRESVEKIAATGLPLEVIEDSVRLAMNGPASVADKWRYFCGTCWRRAETLRVRAEAIMRAQS